MATKLDNFREIIKCLPAEMTKEQLIEELRNIKNYTDIYWQPEDISSIIISIYECYDIEGYNIQDLERATSPKPNTLLLASTSEDKTGSVNATYDQISSDAFLHIQKQLKDAGCLKTMSFANKVDYALSDHNHDDLYVADLSVEYSPWYEEQVQAGTEMQTVGVLSAKTWDANGRVKTDIWQIDCPKISFDPPDPRQPVIGELKFLPIQNIQQLYAGKLKTYGDVINVDIFADDFDGWVFPNGVTFTCEVGQFEKAIEAFKGTATSFTVPTLNSFLYGITQKSNKNPLQIRQAQCRIGKHNHTIKTSSITGKLELDKSATQLKGLKVTTSDINAPKIPTDREGVAFFGSSSQYQYVSDTGSKNVKIDTTKIAKLDIQTVPSADDGLDYQPTCQLMPVLMYIGPRNLTLQPIT